MKKQSLTAYLGLIVYLVASGCTQKVDIVSEQANVKLVVDQFEQFWETEDMELLSNIMAHDSDMVNYGSDASEVFKGWEDFRISVEKMIPAFENTRINVRDQVIKVHSSGKVAWFSEIWDWDLMYNGHPAQIDDQRLTGVLENRNGNWVFVQFHNSVPVTE